MMAADLIAERPYLVRFAQRRLRDPLLAEDVVHDVFEAVLAGRAVFAGRSAFRSWLTGVLKHKIVDTVRRNTGFESDEEVPEQVSRAPGPAEIAEQRELLSVVLARIETLQPGLREAFRLRVLEEEPTPVVCAALGISEDNLFVRLHRARKALSHA